MYASGVASVVPRAYVRDMTEMGEPLRIECDRCVMQHTAACADCVVTFLCERRPDQSVEVDEAEARALRLLGEAGLVPRLRHVPRVG
jgi:hypothetical protein